MTIVRNPTPAQLAEMRAATRLRWFEFIEPGGARVRYYWDPDRYDSARLVEDLGCNGRIFGVTGSC